MNETQQPTVRSIAAVAGVSATTVALALRNAQRIPPATRDRIKAIAKAQGYRSDPAVRKLMHHLRTRRVLRVQANICVLVPPSSAQHNFSEELIKGIRHRAESLGYALSTLPFANTEAEVAPLQRILKSRGIEGVILTPFDQPQRLNKRFDPSRLCVVAATSSVLNPRFHCVTPNHYDNMIMACRALISTGAQRIGLAISKNHDERVRHRSAGAITWHMFFGRTERVEPLVASAAENGIIAKWLATERPQAIIADYEMEQRLVSVIAQMAGRTKRPKIITVNWPSPFASAGIDQREAEIGAASVDVLAGMIERGEKGIPKNPRNTMIDGVWRTKK